MVVCGGGVQWWCVVVVWCSGGVWCSNGIVWCSGGAMVWCSGGAMVWCSGGAMVWCSSVVLKKLDQKFEPLNLLVTWIKAMCMEH